MTAKYAQPMEGCPLVGALLAEAGAAHGTRRRRLWQLPAQAHELLLGLGLAPDVLRREAARRLGHVHQGRCVLQGRDVDVLYAVVHDMATRNPLSEAFQKLLDARHALPLRRFAKLRDRPALAAAWAEALADDTVPAALWALLTHPLGQELEADVLYDARAWAFAHVRRGVARVHERQERDSREQSLRQQVESLQARLLDEQRHHARAIAEATEQIARLRGDLARAQAKASGLQPPETSPVSPRNSVPMVPATGAQRPGRTSPPPVSSIGDVAGPPAAPAPRPNGRSIEVHGRRVLCVGGIQHAVSRYRGRIEQLGGEFDHHDGGIEDNVHALDGRLARAEVVICQAACINHEAYQRVKRHCDRTGKPCLYLERPSLSRLERALVRTSIEQPAHAARSDAPR